MKNIQATIFIPTWFGEKYLDEVLYAVFRQKVDFDFEVLIYDTSSTDNTQAIIKKYEKKHKNLRWKEIAKTEFGHGKTRNAAAHDARGKIVVYISQDVTPAHDRWLYEMVRAFDISPDIVGVTGKQDPRPHCFPLLKSEIKAVFSGLGPDVGTTVYYNDTFVQDQATYDRIAFYSDVNSAARRDFLINNIPYRDVPYAEDQLLGRDIIDAGYMKAYVPRGNVLHSNDMELHEYKNRMFDETVGLRKIGLTVTVPSIRLIARMVATGAIKDTWRIIKDHQYSWKRKLYWLVFNPVYHIEKWRGVRLATLADIEDDTVLEKHSLELNRERKWRK